jgi:hypothetical protein
MQCRLLWTSLSCEIPPMPLHFHVVTCEHELVLHVIAIITATSSALAHAVDPQHSSYHTTALRLCKPTWRSSGGRFVRCARQEGSCSGAHPQDKHIQVHGPVTDAHDVSGTKNGITCVAQLTIWYLLIVQV